MIIVLMAGHDIDRLPGVQFGELPLIVIKQKVTARAFY
jgi:hypothetical protein